MLQPLIDVERHGKSDPERGRGSGLSTTDIGLPLRYENTRELARYIGVVWKACEARPPISLRRSAKPLAGPESSGGFRDWAFWTLRPIPHRNTTPGSSE